MGGDCFGSQGKPYPLMMDWHEEKNGFVVEPLATDRTKNNFKKLSITVATERAHELRNWKSYTAPHLPSTFIHFSLGTVKKRPIHSNMKTKT